MKGDADPPLSRVRRYGLAASLLAGAVVFLMVVDRHYPIGQWLFWTYVRCWLAVGTMTVACLSVGNAALRRVTPLAFPLRERLFFAFALGLLSFALGIFILGICHLLVAPVFWLWPLACSLAGARGLARDAERVRRHLWRAGAPARGSGWPAWRVVALLFGAGGIALLYANVLTPLNASYDARWYHFALAEHYVAAGRIGRFPEGFFGAAWPHLASWLYTWAFLAKAPLAERMVLAAHVELVVFLATLAGIPIAVRYMLGGRRAPGAWAAVFLFPGILLYDSSLCGDADHVLALWALATLLALRRVWRTFDRGAVALFAAFCAAAVLTKYQALSVLAFPLAAFLVVAVVRMRRPEQGGPTPAKVAGSVLLAGGLAVVLWAPHWLKNLLWYGDPLYPMLRGSFPDHPWAPHAVAGFTSADWTASGPFWTELGRGLGVLLTFSFVPHDWLRFHAAIPVFGSLFTLGLLALPWLPRARRIWIFVAAAEVGVLAWYWSVHQDRYLQALLPWMAAVVAAVGARLWHAGRAPRAAVALLVGLQVVWGGDVYFFPTHAVLGRAPLQATAELLSSGFRGDTHVRLDTGSELAVLAPHLRSGDRLLVHESEVRLGTETEVVTDARGAQGGIDYTSLVTPRAIWELFHRFGVTQLVWKPAASPRPEQTLANEILFRSFLGRAGVRPLEVGAFHLAALPDAPPAEGAPHVGVLGCPDVAEVPPGELDRLVDGPAATVPVKDGAEAPFDVWLLDERCATDAAHRLPDGYAQAGRFPPFTIGVRR